MYMTNSPSEWSMMLSGDASPKSSKCKILSSRNNIGNITIRVPLQYDRYSRTCNIGDDQIIIEGSCYVIKTAMQFDTACGSDANITIKFEAKLQFALLMMIHSILKNNLHFV